MDSKTRLDSALFQLTPTRTRFDLVLFRHEKKEKIASGIFEPFISHLKFARDQISKGGYSISLLPPCNDAPWFTKATFERFVLFVNTPAILERFVSIENEILQIELSIQANETSNSNGAVQPEEGSNSEANGNLRKSADPSKLRSEIERNDVDVQEENSKIQLQRLLETRKTLLRREQAMAYARGVVAGFEMDSMDDLISFADAFGASRLREACIKYKELWKKKHGDGLWMAELAAVEAWTPSEMPLLAPPGIVFINETSDSTINNAGVECKTDDKLPTSDHQIPSTASKFQAPMAWPNQIPPYFYNFGGPMQQVPPYPGYPLGPMQPVPHQYPGNMHWPPKGKSSNKKGSEYLGSSESSESDAESDDSASSLEEQEKSRSRKGRPSRTKHRKKSSKTVIIRNINYITPEGGRNEDAEGDELTGTISFKQKVDAAVGLLVKEKGAADKSIVIANGSDAGKHDSDNDPVNSTSEIRKTNENWDAFQNLVMRDDETKFDRAEKSKSILGEEHFTLRSSDMNLKSEDILGEGKVSADSLLVTERNGENRIGAKFEHFENGDSCHKLMRNRDSMEETLLLPPRVEESGNGRKDILSATGADTSVVKSGRAEDWFVADHSGKLQNEHTAFDGDCVFSSEGYCNNQAEKSRKEILVDDSFMVQPLHVADDLYDARWKPDISMVADLSLDTYMENASTDISKHKREVANVGEPNDLCVVLERDSRLESVEDSWAMDYGIEFSAVEANGRRSSVQSNNEDEIHISSGEKTTKVKGNDVRGRRDLTKDAKSKVPNGSLAKNRTELISRNSKKPSPSSRPMLQKSRLEREEEMRKRAEELVIQRQKRIAERTAAAASRRVSTESKTAKPLPATREANRISSVRVRAT